MNRTIEAIYRNGVLRPLQPLDLPEELRVILDIHSADTRLPGDSLAAWQAVYAGLSAAAGHQYENIGDGKGFCGERDALAAERDRDRLRAHALRRMPAEKIAEAQTRLIRAPASG